MGYNEGLTPRLLVENLHQRKNIWKPIGPASLSKKAAVAEKRYVNILGF